MNRWCSVQMLASGLPDSYHYSYTHSIYDGASYASAIFGDEIAKNFPSA